MEISIVMIIFIKVIGRKINLMGLDIGNKLIKIHNKSINYYRIDIQDILRKVRDKFWVQKYYQTVQFIVVDGLNLKNMALGLR